ncbi:TcaA NTF2-like domain-containing protein [Salinicoccus kekensis]|uniref:Uncharacterized membrane protein YvbJ n=1 Tax=Salinicoccus kekensis TaxID=714307 RepID=A0A285U6U3_9STAP|nr:zinc-ribbon domain-containing protein [Salinicoccus kekensis]SOC37654.1 uncharacterized membrane protein YvbJ [Salinicoccus kekensis]
MKYCKNCGQEIRPDVKVCTNCGQKVDEQEKEKQARPAPAPMDPKKKRRIGIIIGAVALAAIVLAVAYSLIANALSPDNQLDTIAEAVTNEDAEGLRNAVDNDITLDEAEAHIAYIDRNSGFSQYQTWIEDLKYYLDEQVPGNEVHDGLYPLLSVGSNGTQYLFFDDYNFTIPRFNVYASDDYDIDAFTYTMDETEQQWNSDNEKFAELVPGIYEFEGAAVIDEESYDSTMQVDFEYGETAFLNPGFFYLTFDENATSLFWEGIDEEDITVNVNDEAVNVDLSDYDNRVGPYAFGEELAVGATLDYAGETFESDAEMVQIDADEAEDIYSAGGMEPVYSVNLEFDEDAISEAGEAERTAEMADAERESFEEDMEENVENFVRDYLFALEMMYLFEDINEVDPYLDEDSSAYATLQSNLDNGTFEGMFITNISASNFSQDGNTMTIDVESTRDYDSLDDPIDFNTRYNVDYDPETLELEIVSFEDL